MNVEINRDLLSTMVKILECKGCCCIDLCKICTRKNEEFCNENDEFTWSKLKEVKEILTGR